MKKNKYFAFLYGNMQRKFELIVLNTKQFWSVLHNRVDKIVTRVGFGAPDVATELKPESEERIAFLGKAR